MKIAVFPGSFDPLTKGHEEIINRALPLFDKVIIAIGTHPYKSGLFSIEERISFIENCFKDHPIEVRHYIGLTGDFCNQVGAQFIIRGLRNSLDFEYEKDIAHTNKILFNIDTLFFIADQATSHISSSIVRDIYKHGGDISKLVPQSVISK
jgi:pantetheine-phosphate adenylyltransferase